MFEMILNRYRGTGDIFIIGSLKITGVMLYTLYLGLLVGFLSEWYYGIITGILFLAGESYAWGTWVSYLCYPENHEKEYDSKVGRGFPYIHYIANSVTNQYKDYKRYCEIALTLRGFFWWFPIILLLLFLNLLPIWFAFISLIGLSIGFPVACYLSRIWNFEYSSKFISVRGNWEKQEIIYGFFHFMFLTAPLIYFL